MLYKHDFQTSFIIKLITFVSKIFYSLVIACNSLQTTHGTLAPQNNKIETEDGNFNEGVIGKN